MATEVLDFLVGKTVEQIWVWGPIRFVFEFGDAPEPDAYVDVHTATLKTADGNELELDVFERRAEAGAVFRLLHRAVVAAGIENGVLHLSFANDDEPQSPPNDEYETWTVVGDGRVIQCLPGGEITSW